MFKYALIILLACSAIPAQNLEQLQNEIFSARDKTAPSLVHIQPVVSFYSTGEKRHTVVTGSGFIFSQRGYILTNNHVVENAEKVEVTLYNKKKYQASIIGTDPSTDVAVIQLMREEGESADFPAVKLGNSDSLEVGQIVLALGSPLGLSRSVSMGVVSSLDRYFETSGGMTSPYNLWIQTDAAINPGNSGGPLINLNGEVVGINARGVMMAENLGFAIPINLAREISDKLISGKKVSRAWIGVQLQPVREYREYAQNPAMKGALISHIEQFSPAEKAGLRAGDLLLAINDSLLHAEYEEDLPAIRKIMSDLPPEEMVNLSILREGKQKNIQILPQLEPFETPREFECEAWGMVVKSMERHVFKMHNLPDFDGVYVSGLKNGEAAALAGIRIGDVIRKMENEEIQNLDRFKSTFNALRQFPDSQSMIEIYRDGGKYYACLKNPD